ncbi:hypothetical protein HZH66_012682 [Vespula vulgaris]|uniref:Uncharacterized protein n=1 Tax=Vespula vulgaris TaxID=7454 RepID=A0A834JC24_VESVU|nr:hypothetical protein HZH66_012682 [Vespula vulgaris]
MLEIVELRDLSLIENKRPRSLYFEVIVAGVRYNEFKIRLLERSPLTGMRLHYPTGEVSLAKEELRSLIKLGEFSGKLFLVIANIVDDYILGRDFLLKTNLVDFSEEITEDIVVENSGIVEYIAELTDFRLIKQVPVYLRGKLDQIIEDTRIHGICIEESSNF